MLSLRKGDLCPICEEGNLQKAKRDVSFTYKGRAKVFETQKVLVCSLCGHEAFPKTTSENVEREVTDFRRVIDGLLTSRELRDIRLNLGLKKNQMAKLLSVNAKTIGRYENNKIVQSEQIDKLYRIFRSFPLVAKRLAKSKELLKSIEGGAWSLRQKISLSENAAASVLVSRGRTDSSGNGMLPGVKKLAPSAYTTYLRKEGSVAA